MRLLRLHGRGRPRRRRVWRWSRTSSPPRTTTTSASRFAAGRRPVDRIDPRPLPHVRLARARDHGDVRDPLRGPPASGEAPAGRALRGPSRCARTSRSCPARRSRGRAPSRARRGGGRVIAAVRDRRPPDELLAGAARQDRARARVLPHGAARGRLHGAQGAGAHAGAPGPHGGRRLPRLGPAGRRRREVHPEGGRHPRGGGPLRVLAGAGGRADPLHRDARRAAAVGVRLRARPRRRHLLRAGDVERRGDRRADGGLVLARTSSR